MQDAVRPLALVVDDQPDNVQALGAILQEEGYEVVTAVSGPQAVARVQARRPAVVLLDMMMPLMDGCEVCRTIHASPGLADVPVIFLTGSTDRELVNRAFAAGGVDYVTKPFVVEELLARVRTHVDLKRARDHLQAMVREREDTTHVVAHDLKNPLTAILFAARSLRRAQDDQRRAELIDDIAACSDEALRFIKRFLARGAEGQRLRQFSREATDLSSLVTEAFQFLRWAAEAGEVRLRLDGGPAPIVADPTGTRNVMQNLIANAIRYSPRGEEVVVAVGPGRAGFSQALVLDRGPGIPEAEQEQLFRRFARLASARPDEHSSGLGLAIAKHDVSLMGGYLWYEPRPGGGSIFGFELPRLADSSGEGQDAKKSGGG